VATNTLATRIAGSNRRNERPESGRQSGERGPHALLGRFPRRATSSRGPGSRRDRWPRNRRQRRPLD